MKRIGCERIPDQPVVTLSVNLDESLIRKLLGNASML